MGRVLYFRGSGGHRELLPPAPPISTPVHAPVPPPSQPHVHPFLQAMHPTAWMPPQQRGLAGTAAARWLPWG